MFLPEGRDQDLGQDLGQYKLPDRLYRILQLLLILQGLRIGLFQGVSRMEELQIIILVIIIRIIILKVVELRKIESKKGM